GGDNLDAALNAPAGQGVLDGPTSSGDGIWLGALVGRERAGYSSPRVEGFGNVGDAVGLLGGPEQEVVVLAPVVAGAKADDVQEQGRPNDRQMAHVVLGHQLVRGPIRLEMGVDQPPLEVDPVFVGVDQVDGGVGCDPASDLGEGVWFEEVVVIKESDEV